MLKDSCSSDRLSLPGAMDDGMLKETKVGSFSYEHKYCPEDEGELAVAVRKDKDRYHVTLITDIPGPLTLHWGVAKRFRDQWTLPPSSLLPAGTVIFQDKAAETPFLDEGGRRKIHLLMRGKNAPMGIAFVLRQGLTGRWLKDDGRDFYIPVVIPPEYAGFLGDLALAGLAHEIIEKEMSPYSWTLMHRFNLCYDLLDNVENNIDGLALIYVWLRYSAIRQLDWQRNYNTKPRELSHAQDRLTLKLAEYYVNQPQGREFIRLILTTMGRGSEGQQVRDEVLNIMHRHHIKEVSGHFMEEWHQKLHNNTTPDDVAICEAYLQFLMSDGDLDTFYDTLETGGVTRDRLESYERPIVSHPDFIPNLKEALIHDFEHFLGILKAVHSGTDLGTATRAARRLFDTRVNDLMDFIWKHRNDPEMQVRILVENITEARRYLKIQLEDLPTNGRDLLFLDLALENLLRVVMERNLHAYLSGDELVELIAMVVENFLISRDDDELTYSLGHWKRLMEMPGFARQWSLEAKAVLDRIGRALGANIDDYYHVLQPKAEFLGKAFDAEPWTITLFSEEVVRGSPAFVLSMLLRQMDPILRKSAQLGNWQVVSPGRGVGKVEVVASLKSVQGKNLAHPTVIVADRITGEEEIPEKVAAVITPDATDIVSHVAIRARNARLLFATCYDQDTIAELKSFSGHWLKLSVSAAGDVVFEEGRQEVKAKGTRSPYVQTVSQRLSRPAFTVYAVSGRDFSEKNVGGKSNNLKHLKDKAPNWINIPTSAALPFGVFERVLAQEKNKETARHYETLIQQLEKHEGKVRYEVLSELHKTVMALEVPDELVSSLCEVMDEAGISWPANWEDTWMCIKGVWGSKWNERAYMSRRARRISHEDLFIAVLIQEVVEADYSFVIHTVNPFAGNRDQIYAEVVPGLGETLVGNYPGKAFSFTCTKGGGEPEIVAFPSKSLGLFGSGLIFRSDSNGEDLADYAGAGLYDSIMLKPPTRVSLDYNAELLIRDKDFRKEFMGTVANIGTAIEKALGCPQDIEGAYRKGEYYVVQTRPQVGIEGE